MANRNYNTYHTPGESSDALLASIIGISASCSSRRPSVASNASSDVGSAATSPYHYTSFPPFSRQSSFNDYGFGTSAKSTKSSSSISNPASMSSSYASSHRSSGSTYQGSLYSNPPSNTARSTIDDATRCDERKMSRAPRTSAFKSHY